MMLSMQAISEVRVVGDPMWSLFILLSKCVLALVVKAGLSAYYSPEHGSSLSHLTYMSHSYNHTHNEFTKYVFHGAFKSMCQENIERV